ncbi:MAG: hypothetical protein LBR55_01040 [Bacteroidales bacterium]|jgi:nucleoid DNA-binding protein|nr:hypothetical protein [Bacteroidales bacterium]
MDIAHILYTKLFTNDCITISGLGCFQTQYHAARIVQSKKTTHCMPPCKTLSFIENTCNETSDLQTFIQNDYALPAEEAAQHIQLFVQSILQQLHSGKQVAMQGIGTFSMQNTIVFEADASTNFYIDSFGMTNFFIEN